MTKEELISKRAAVSQKFDSIQEELLRLQGEYRLYTDLIDRFTEQDQITSQDSPDTTNVDEVTEKSEDEPTEQ